MFQNNQENPRVTFTAIDGSGDYFRISLPLELIDLVEESKNNTCIISSGDLTYRVLGDFNKLNYLVNGYNLTHLN